MEPIRFMVVSGFLGAGKTTSMIALAQHMDEHWGKTAIIANDLGANLVDTHLTQTSGCTVTEIASGCICYQMDNCVEQIRRLRDREGAKFVMSDIPGCGVGALDHVYHMIAREHSDEFVLAPFTVIVDPERLRMIMPERADIHLPSELIYLLRLQLEEADLIVLNKCDLLSDEQIERYLSFLREACPETPVLNISARERTGIEAVVDMITTGKSALKNVSVAGDTQFDEAEAKLTWYNRRAILKASSAIDFDPVIDDLIEGIRMGLIEARRNVPHLKVFATSDDVDFCKASLIGVDYDTEYERHLGVPATEIRLIVNARATCEAVLLAPIVDRAFDEVCEQYGLDADISFTECFGLMD